MMIEVQLGKCSVLKLIDKLLERLLVERVYGDLRVRYDRFANLAHLHLRQRGHIVRASLQVKYCAEHPLGNLGVLNPLLIVSDS